MKKGRENSSKNEDYLISNEIESWATENDFVDHFYISGIINALRAQKDRNSWLTLDPNEYLPTKSKNNLRTLQRSLSLLNLARNSLVFLPVAITWLAISKATSAFSIYGKSNALNLINLLDFWQNGYGVLSPKWSLSEIATLDFQIILTVIALTIASSLLNQRIVQKRVTTEEHFQKTRQELSMLISLHANRTTLKNLKNLKSKLAEDLLVKDNRKTLKNLRNYAP